MTVPRSFVLIFAPGTGAKCCSWWRKANADIRDRRLSDSSTSSHLHNQFVDRSVKNETRTTRPQTLSWAFFSCCGSPSENTIYIQIKKHERLSTHFPFQNTIHSRIFNRQFAAPDTLKTLIFYPSTLFLSSPTCVDLNTSIYITIIPLLMTLLESTPFVTVEI